MASGDITVTVEVLQDIVLVAMLEIMKTETEVMLVAEQLPDDICRMALRAPTAAKCRTYPLFDPENGEHELAGYGTTYEKALSALRTVLSRYFASHVSECLLTSPQAGPPRRPD